MAHSDHDEAYNRAHWRPMQDCLGGGLETTRAPKYEPARKMAKITVDIAGQVVELPLGSMNWGSRAHVKSGGKGTYR